ncbi:SRPBCC domain-containing protein [Eisenibacter elegans]|uniref:SRPBCC domain-containing protein n=1 Tax=Eisenibacter elegans TaxID=997 RepID=UPI00047CD5BB|nr:SRPBCC domain-containing protein [Eisenibacter elegans]
MKAQIITEIVINAPKEQVFSVLTNLEAYQEWNPFIIRSEGKVMLGARLKNTMKNGDSPITFKPKVTQVVENEYFEWLGSLGIKGLFDGRHYFKIEEIAPNQVNLIHGESFSGLLVGYVLRKIGKQTRAGFVRMNEALKQRTEALAQHSAHL